MTWPTHALRLTAGDVVLSGTTEADALHLAAVVPADLEHDPSFPAFLTPGQKVLRQYWREAAGWSVDDWVLPFTVRRAGAVVGVQALEAKEFAVRRTVETYSWLVPSVRGTGLGKQVRAMVLELAFGHLGAAYAVTEAWEDNHASLGVSRALGYAPNGLDVHAGGRRRQRMLLADWQPREVQVDGLAPCLDLLGLDPV